MRAEQPSLAGNGYIHTWVQPGAMEVEGLHPARHDCGMGAWVERHRCGVPRLTRGAGPGPVWHPGPQCVHCAQWVREERFRGQRCAVWQNVSYWGHKKNVYTLRVGSSARGPVPLHFEVHGFNSLLGSHYDKYEIDYSSFSHRFPPSVFRLPQGECPGHLTAQPVPKCSTLPPFSFHLSVQVLGFFFARA